MLPKLHLDNVVEEVSAEEKKTRGKTFLYDFDKGDFIVRDGRLVVAEGKEGIKIWIEKLILTEEFKFEIYKESNSENEYGTTIKRLIQGRKIPKLLLESELKRIIEEKVTEHIEIERIEDFNTIQEMATLTISFTVILKDGDTFIQEVSF